MSFTERLSHLWRTRPVRLPEAGPGAGVAVGFARRYGVDPVLVRVAFVVATIFGGAGPVLYLAAWLLFAKSGDQASAAESLFGKGHSSLSKTKTIVILVVLVIAVSSSGTIDEGIGSSGMLGMALMLGGWWLLYRRHPEGPPTAATDESWELSATHSTGLPAEPVPFTGELPEQPAPAVESRSRWTSTVVGLAVLAAAGAGAAALLGVDWLTPARIASVALAVVGIGLVVGAFVRRGYGLLLVAVPLTGFVVIASAAGSVHFDRTASGDHTWVPTRLTDLKHDYRVNLGEGTLDLRGLDLTEARTVKLDVTAGQLRVLAPPSMTVHTVCRSVAGQCPPEGTRPGYNKNGPVLDLNVDVLAGEVEVDHG